MSVDRYALQREPENSYSRNAIAVVTRPGCRRGYVKEEHATFMARILDLPSVFGGVRVVSSKKWCAESKRSGMKQNGVVTLTVKERYLSVLEENLKDLDIDYSTL